MINSGPRHFWLCFLLHWLFFHLVFLLWWWTWLQGIFKWGLCYYWKRRFLFAKGFSKTSGAGSHWLVLGHLQIPELITVTKRSEAPRFVRPVTGKWLDPNSSHFLPHYQHRLEMQEQRFLKGKSGFCYWTQGGRNTRQAQTIAVQLERYSPCPQGLYKSEKNHELKKYYHQHYI